MALSEPRRHLLVALAILGASGTACSSGGGGDAAPPAPAAGPGPAPAPAAAALPTAAAVAARMGIGWNLGNSLEAIGGETAWGNARTTQALIDAVKAAGFGNVRIPVAWRQYADASDRIRADWLARVAEVVGYVRNAGMVAMINVHWDGGWLQPTYAAQAEANARLQRYWTQIATHFREHDEGLLFAGTNEVMKDGDYGPPTAEYLAVQNGFNQVFVDAVRATGGRNATRPLVVQGFNTNIDHTVAGAVLPRDSATERLMMEVHFYDPYRYTIDESSTLWQWGTGATDPALKESWGDEAWVDAQFLKMKQRFGDRGVPVVLGEYGVMARPQFSGAEAYREAWLRYVTGSARRHGLVPQVWDNGVLGRHGMGLFDRATGRQAYPGAVQAIVGAAR